MITTIENNNIIENDCISKNNFPYLFRKTHFSEKVIVRVSDNMMVGMMSYY